MARKKTKDTTVEVLDTKPKRKRKKVKEEVAETPKKRKKKSKEIAVSKEKKKAGKSLERRLEKRKAKVLELAVEAEVLPASSESAFYDEYSHIFESLQELTRIAEDKYRTSEQSRDIYALMSMYSQMRECIADMRSIQDLNVQSDALISAILEPFLKSVGQTMVEQFFKMEKIIKANLKGDAAEDMLEELRSITQDSASKVQEHYATSKGMVYKHFTENH